MTRRIQREHLPFPDKKFNSNFYYHDKKRALVSACSISHYVYKEDAGYFMNIYW